MEDSARSTLIQFLGNSWTEDNYRLLQLLFSLSLEEERQGDWKKSKIWKMAHRLAAVQFLPEKALLYLKDVFPFDSDVNVQVAASCEEIWLKNSCKLGESSSNNSCGILFRPGSSGLAASINCLPLHRRIELSKTIEDIYHMYNLTVAPHQDSTATSFIDKVMELSPERATVKLVGSVAIAAAAGCVSGVVLGAPASTAAGLFIGGNVLAYGCMHAYDKWNAIGPTKDDLQGAYKYLGVTSNAERKEIETAFKQLSTIHHPDKGGSNEEFQKLSYYKTLLLQRCTQ